MAFNNGVPAVPKAPATAYGLPPPMSRRMTDDPAVVPVPSPVRRTVYRAVPSGDTANPTRGFAAVPGITAPKPSVTSTTLDGVRAALTISSRRVSDRPSAT